MSEKKLLECLTGSEALELMDLARLDIIAERKEGGWRTAERDIPESLSLKEGLQNIQNNIDYFEEREKFVKQKTDYLKEIQSKLKKIPVDWY